MRFVIEGGGIFWIRDRHGRLVAIEVQPGDMIRVPDVYIAQGPAYPRHPAVSEPGGRTRTTPPRRRKRLKTMRAVLLDREGTVWPIHFVSSQLFPSVPEHVDEWAHAHSTDAGSCSSLPDRSPGSIVTAIRPILCEGRFGRAPSPFLGYFFFPKIATALRRRYATRNLTSGWTRRLTKPSYSKRCELLCRRLVLERVYSSACLVMATTSPKTKLR